MSEFNNLLSFDFDDSKESDIESLISSVSDRSDNKNKKLDMIDNILSLTPDTLPIQTRRKQNKNELFTVPIYQTVVCFDGKRYIYKKNSNIYSLIIE